MQNGVNQAGRSGRRACCPSVARQLQGVRAHALVVGRAAQMVLVEQRAVARASGLLPTSKWRLSAGGRRKPHLHVGSESRGNDGRGNMELRNSRNGIPIARLVRPVRACSVPSFLSSRLHRANESANMASQPIAAGAAQAERRRWVTENEKNRNSPSAIDDGDQRACDRLE